LKGKSYKINKLINWPDKTSVLKRAVIITSLLSQLTDRSQMLMFP
jgi:hypothetical protein